MSTPREDDRRCSARHKEPEEKKRKGVGDCRSARRPRLLACLVARCAGVRRSISHILYACTTIYCSQPCRNGYFPEFHIKQPFFLVPVQDQISWPLISLSVCLCVCVSVSLSLCLCLCLSLPLFLSLSILRSFSIKGFSQQ